MAAYAGHAAGHKTGDVFSAALANDTVAVRYGVPNGVWILREIGGGERPWDGHR